MKGIQEGPPTELLFCHLNLDALSPIHLQTTQRIKQRAQPCGSGPGALEERGKNLANLRASPVPRASGKCSQLDSEKSTVEGRTHTAAPGAPGCHVEWGRNVPVKRVSEETFLP